MGGYGMAADEGRADIVFDAPKVPFWSFRNAERVADVIEDEFITGVIDVDLYSQPMQLLWLAAVLILAEARILAGGPIWWSIDLGGGNDLAEVLFCAELLICVLNTKATQWRPPAKTVNDRSCVS